MSQSHQPTYPEPALCSASHAASLGQALCAKSQALCAKRPAKALCMRACMNAHGLSGRGPHLTSTSARSRICCPCQGPCRPSHRQWRTRTGSHCVPPSGVCEGDENEKHCRAAWRQSKGPFHKSLLHPTRAGGLPAVPRACAGEAGPSRGRAAKCTHGLWWTSSNQSQWASYFWPFM